MIFHLLILDFRIAPSQTKNGGASAFRYSLYDIILFFCVNPIKQHSFLFFFSSDNLIRLLEKASELGDKESERWSSYQYVGRTGSAIPTASLGGTEVSVEEIRSAAASEYYPPSLHAALISSPEPDPNGIKYKFFKWLDVD